MLKMGVLKNLFKCHLVLAEWLFIYYKIKNQKLSYSEVRASTHANVSGGTVGVQAQLRLLMRHTNLTIATSSGWVSGHAPTARTGWHLNQASHSSEEVRFDFIVRILRAHQQIAEIMVIC